MFRSILIAVISVLKLSGCSPSNPVNRNAPGGPRCYSCPSVEEPYLCNVTTQCGHDEQCYTDEYSTNGGTNIFSVGCRRISECYTAIVQRSVSSKRDVKPLKCVECCHGNLCNRGGCSAGLGKSNVCYNCRFIKDPRRCQHETICQGDEHCFIEKVLTQIYDIKYIQGCVENAECQRLRQFGLPVGKRDKTISTMCASCCYGDRCNDECFLNGTLVTTRPLVTTDTFVVDTTGGASYTSILMNIDTTRLASTSSPSATTDTETTIASSSAIPLMNTDRTFVHETSLESSSSPSTITDTTIVSSPTSSLMSIDSTPVDTARGTPSISPSISTGGPVLYTASGTPYISPSVSTAAPVLYTARATSSISSLMTTDATVVDTKIQPSSSNPPRISTVFLDSSEAPPASPSMNTDTTTTNGVQSSLLATSTFHELSTIRHGVTASPSTSTTPPMSTHGTSPGKYLSTSPTPYISPSMSTAAPVLYTARATSSISPLMTTDATVVDTKIQPSSSNPPRISTVFLDSSEAPPASPSMNTDTATANGVQSSLLATSTFHELSTIRHGVTASPSTSTTPSMSTHGTSPGKEMTTICHADCDGLSGCILPKIQTCSGATPYCFTQVDNADSGAFNIKKRCADRTTCNTKWWHQTSDDDRCVDYKQGNMNTFSCFYCCTTDKCNLDNIQPSSLFKGDD
ncbi:mucin-5AC-like isoform X2 [Haliotis rubra]|uniref:mucin-5AC-like isoform X2 n=1 Tax=Haliotis rubra TaxID=36100 RepID=UPI001EE5D2E2|nr:mucin-5AC-like isoform X2 [Haliotis rubra]